MLVFIGQIGEKGEISGISAGLLALLLGANFCGPSGKWEKVADFCGCKKMPKFYGGRAGVFCQLFADSVNLYYILICKRRIICIMYSFGSFFYI
jgi:hypothetical protein